MFELARKKDNYFIGNNENKIIQCVTCKGYCFKYCFKDNTIYFCFLNNGDEFNTFQYIISHEVIHKCISNEIGKEECILFDSKIVTNALDDYYGVSIIEKPFTREDVKEHLIIALGNLKEGFK